MLYFVATPIGNLADISFRAVATLKKCDYILCEDTRYSKSLLTPYEIDRPLKSYHKFNEEKRIAIILDDLREGKEIALISDAGMPGICDPGERLASACIQNNLPFTVVPGPNAALMALTLSGFSCTRFQFVGFLPKSQGELLQVLQEILSYPGTTVAYETPVHLVKTLLALEQFAGERPIAIARELTKMHEECLRGSVKDLLTAVQATPLKGEIVLIIEGQQKKETVWPEIFTHVEQLQR